MSRRKKCLIGCATTLAIFVGAGAIHHYRVKWAVERYKAELIDQGELLTIEECLPPPIPAEKNSAPLFLSVTTNLVYEGPLATNGGGSTIMIAPGRAMTGWAQPWFGDAQVGWFSNSWAEALADLDTRSDEVEKLDRLAASPLLQFESDYADAWFDAKSLVRFLPGLKQAAQLLGAAAQCELHQGNTEKAAQHLHAELAIIQGTTENRWLITQLVRAAVAGVSASTTWDLLQSRNLNEADLDALQRRWTALEFIEAMEHSFQMERATGLRTFQEMRSSLERFDTVAGHLFSVHLPLGQTEAESPFLDVRKSWARLKFYIAFFVWRYWWSYTDEYTFLQRCQNGLEQCRAVITDGNGLRSHAINEEFTSADPERETDRAWGRRGFSGLRTLVNATWTKALVKALRAETVKQLTITAIALERYQLENGAYPDQLSNLEPEYLDHLTVDPIDGQPMRYRRLDEEGFVLYSIGDNHRDDGGEPNWIEEKPEHSQPPSGYYQVQDWVWSQHASEEEVLAYWKKEVGENYVRLFVPDGEIDPYTGVPYEALSPMINPTTGEPIRHPDTGRMMLALDGQYRGIDWEDRIDSLAPKWTEQYFHTLTNRDSGSSAVED